MIKLIRLELGNPIFISELLSVNYRHITQTYPNYHNSPKKR